MLGSSPSSCPVGRKNLLPKAVLPQILSLDIGEIILTLVSIPNGGSEIKFLM